MESRTAEQAPRTLGDLLDSAARRFAAREAVASERGRLSYAELASAADRVASALIAAGVTKGVRVGLLMPNWPDWLVSAFGVLKTGAWLVGLNTMNRAGELEYSLGASDVAVLITVASFLRNDYAAMLDEIAAPVLAGRRSERLPELRKVIFHGEAPPAGAELWPDFLRRGEDVPAGLRVAVQARINAADTAAVFLTSGSTAQPKAAVLSHGALTLNAFAVGEHLGITPEDRTWTTLPLFFSGGFCLCATSTLAGGGSVVLNEVFEPAAALERLESERCTVMVGWNHVPLLLEHPDFAKRKLVLRKGVGGNLALADRFLGPGHQAVGNYGMTETATFCCSARFDDPPEVRRTHGRPRPGVTIRIVSPETGGEVPPGEEGEILVRSPAQMSHYYGMTPAECFDEQGFFHTGDLGRIDRNGCLEFTKRLKDVIKTMGVNVAGPDVERALESHPKVKRAVVVGVPHPVRGENVAAFVVRREPDLAVADLLAFARERLASYKVPRHVFFCAEEEIPLSASNKVEKAKLRERAVATIGAPES
ncbi:MAG: class I adenylate-forming enzyme family protein [Candidatus Binatia bacterium]